MRVGDHALVLVLALGLGEMGVLGKGIATAKTSQLAVPAAESARRRGSLGSERACGCGSARRLHRGFASRGRRAALGLRGGAPAVSDRYNARIQVMITRNMRKVLMDELGYAADEVDDMDPQIAAVVIEKSLPRPRAGMPIAWRRSIRQTGSSSNPAQLLAGAVLAAVGAVVNGAVAAAAFPFVVAGKGVGAAKAGGVKGAAVTLLALSVMTAVFVTSSASGGDADDKYPGAAYLRSLGENVASAKALVLSRGKDGGRTSGTDRLDGKSGRAISSGGTPKTTAGAAGRRWLGATNNSNKPDATNTPKGGAESSSAAQKEERPHASASKGNGGLLNKQHRAGQDGCRGRQEETRRQERDGGNFPEPSSDNAAGEGLRGERLPEGSSGSASSRRWRAARVKRGTPKGGEVYKSEPLLAAAVDEGEEVLQDALPVGLNAEGAATFEDLPPAPPAPDTIGVLDEKEESPWNEPDPPRWGRRPMPEHIPSEEEMEAWDSKMAVPDMWLDRAINGVMGSLFGGGDDKVDSE
ncbi:unnamed protein product [Ectocarpus sp. 4 AP-2014]